MPENLRVGPVQILYDDQGRAAAAGVRRDRRRHRALAAVARGVVHRVIERTPFAGLRQIKKIARKTSCCSVMIPDRPTARRPARLSSGEEDRRKIKKALQQAANWVLPPADAEIEHQAPMGAKSARLGEATAFARQVASCRCPPRHAHRRRGRSVGRARPRGCF